MLITLALVSSCLLSGHPVSHHLAESTLDLDWSSVFVTDPQIAMLYDVNVGTRDGYVDVFTQDAVKVTSVKMPVHRSNSSVWISIRAYHVTGKDKYYRDLVYL